MTYPEFVRWRDHRIEASPEISVLVPAFNEADRILPTIGAIAAHVSSLGCTWELIVVDDGSTDDTVALLRDLDLANLRILTGEPNQGKGAAVRRGVLAAQGRLVLFADADNSTPIEEIDQLIAAIDMDGADVAIGSRAVAGANESDRSLLRQVLSAGLRLLARHTLSVRVRDTQCGFKLFRAAVARDVFQQMTITGFSFDLELLFLAARRGYRIAEVPVQWVDAPGSKVDARREAQRFLRDLVRIRLNHWRGRYVSGSVA